MAWWPFLQQWREPQGGPNGLDTIFGPKAIWWVSCRQYKSYYSLDLFIFLKILACFNSNFYLIFFKLLECEGCDRLVDKKRREEKKWEDTWQILGQRKCQGKEKLTIKNRAKRGILWRKYSLYIPTYGTLPWHFISLANGNTNVFTK